MSHGAFTSIVYAIPTVNKVDFVETLFHELGPTSSAISRFLTKLLRTCIMQ